MSTSRLFHGNSFEGPIPLTLSNLSPLTELRISDVSNDSSLGFIKNMKSLNILDLSFNDISGQIPDSLFNLSLLSILFLGNNKFNGTLPESKKSSLHTVVLPSRLICLQKNFPCIRGPGINYNFGIKCGGPQVISSNGIVYDKENETLGPATYIVNDENRWGVSNTGIFTRSNNNQYTMNSSLQFTSPLDSVLFQTARLSASSLRYYGLGLQNGNYTVNLQFAEQVILDSTSWRSLGRRVFDIYIQVSIIVRDFLLLIYSEFL